MPDLKLILDAVDEIRKTNVGAHNDIRQAIIDGINGVHKDLAATAWITNKDLKDIKAHLAELNGTVASLQKESDKRKLVVDEFHEHVKSGSHKPWLWVKRNWWIILLTFIGLVTLIFVILERFGIVGVMNTVKEIKDIL